MRQRLPELISKLPAVKLNPRAPLSPKRGNNLLKLVSASSRYPLGNHYCKAFINPLEIGYLCKKKDTSSKAPSLQVAEKTSRLLTWKQHKYEIQIDLFMVSSLRTE